MTLSKQAIIDFQQRYLAYYQEEISDSEARLLAENFMQFIKGNVKYYLKEKSKHEPRHINTT